jgi:hypothetical protein
MNITEELKPEQQDCYRGIYRDISYKISRHAKGQSYTPQSEGIWCYYIYLHESKVKDFASLWAEGEVVKITPESYGFVSYEYYKEPFNSIEFHGGITYYAKHGEFEGHRSVELGCDYNHLWDIERGYGYGLTDILVDVKSTIDSVYEANLIKE